MTSTGRPVGAHAVADPALTALAGDLRAEVNRLAYHLGTPATRSGITMTRLAALSVLAHADTDLRAGDLASRMGISPPSATRLIDILVEAGWVLRWRDPDDARAALLRLTPLGRKEIEDLRRENITRLAADLAGMSADEREALATAVPLLRALSNRLVSSQCRHS